MLQHLLNIQTHWQCTNRRATSHGACTCKKCAFCMKREWVTLYIGNKRRILSLLSFCLKSATVAQQKQQKWRIHFCKKIPSAKKNKNSRMWTGEWRCRPPCAHQSWSLLRRSNRKLLLDTVKPLARHTRTRAHAHKTCCSSASTTGVPALIVLASRLRRCEMSGRQESWFVQQSSGKQLLGDWSPRKDNLGPNPITGDSELRLFCPPLSPRPSLTPHQHLGSGSVVTRSRFFSQYLWCHCAIFGGQFLILPGIIKKPVPCRRRTGYRRHVAPGGVTCNWREPQTGCRPRALWVAALTFGVIFRCVYLKVHRSEHPILWERLRWKML